LRAAALIAVGVAALAVIPAASGSSRPVRRAVTVADYFLSPAKLTVPRRSTIVWKWYANNFDTHDVKAVKRPKGAAGFHSEYASTDYRFSHRLNVPGRYVVVCTLHPDKMRQVITVK
jgi:plastocyanin